MRPSGTGLSLWESVERFRCPKEQQCSPSAEAEPSQPRMTPASHLAPGDMPESWRQKGEVCPELYSLKKTKQNKREGERGKRNQQELNSSPLCVRLLEQLKKVAASWRTQKQTVLPGRATLAGPPADMPEFTLKMLWLQYQPHSWLQLHASQLRTTGFSHSDGPLFKRVHSNRLLQPNNV